MTFQEFRNGLCILRSIDQHELAEAGILEQTNAYIEEWCRFRDHPVDWLLRADDETTDKLWALMQRRGA